MARTGPVFTFGQELGFADLEQLPKGEIGYAVRVSNVAAIGASEVDIMTVNSVNVGTSRRVRVDASVMASNNDGDSHVALRLYQGGTILNRMDYQLSPVSNEEIGCPIWGYATGSSGSFTFKLTAERVHGAGAITIECAAFSPGLLTVEDRGPTF